MINYIEANIQQLIIHRVNQSSEGGLELTDATVEIPDERIENLLLQFFFENFSQPELFTFSNMQNPVSQSIAQILKNSDQFINESKQIAYKLYEASEHPNIKSGDLMVAKVSDLLIDDEMLDALCIFKVENLDTLITIDKSTGAYELGSVEGLNIQKLDKACIVFNTEESDGYKICAADKFNKGIEANFWMKDFLHLQPRVDDFYHTKNYIQATKNFVNDRMKVIYETDPTEEAQIMHRSLDFLTYEEDFNPEEYEKRIFKDERVIADFQEYKQDFENEKDIRFAEDFKISPAAIKRQSKYFRSVLKLDKNFHVYIHGNQNMIDKGVEEDGRKYYKLYYHEES